MVDVTRKTVRKDVGGSIVAPTDPSDLYVAIVKSDTVDFVDGLCRAINADADGAVNLVRADGVTVVGFQLHKGYNPVAAIRVDTGGDAINMWALF